MQITKAKWSNEKGRLSLGLDISKIDHETRTVTGFASVDNLDLHGDVITAECAYDAFERFRGNIREMHNQVAVGKIVSFWQQPIYDKETDALYQGVCVKAYISTGAQDTWEKVLDGTLSAFSIGGELVDAEEVHDATNDTIVRFITKMNLHELSLVDNPANQLANVLSFQKVNGETVASGLAVDVQTESVFWCEHDQVSILSKDESLPLCFSCNKQMENIGWVESDTDKLDKMRGVVNSYISKSADTSVSKGGVDMTEEITETAEAVEEIVEEPTDVEAVETEEVVEEDVETPEEEVVVEEEVEKEISAPAFDPQAFLDELKSYVSDAVAKAIAEATTSVTDSMKESLEESTKSIVEGSTKAIDAVKDDITSFKDQISVVAKRVDAVEGATAVKKSGELNGEPAKNIEKGLWSGTFLTAEIL